MPTPTLFAGEGVVDTHPDALHSTFPLLCMTPAGEAGSAAAGTTLFVVNTHLHHELDPASAALRAQQCRLINQWMAGWEVRRLGWGVRVGMRVRMCGWRAGR